MSKNNRASPDPDSEESIGGGVWPLPQDLDNDGVNNMLDILDEDRERSDERMNVENVFVIADDMLVPPLRSGMVTPDPGILGGNGLFEDAGTPPTPRIEYDATAFNEVGRSNPDNFAAGERPPELPRPVPSGTEDQVALSNLTVEPGAETNDSELAERRRAVIGAEAKNASGGSGSGSGRSPPSNRRWVLPPTTPREAIERAEAARSGTLGNVSPDEFPAENSLVNMDIDVATDFNPVPPIPDSNAGPGQDPPPRVPRWVPRPLPPEMTRNILRMGGNPFLGYPPGYFPLSGPPAGMPGPVGPSGMNPSPASPHYPGIAMPASPPPGYPGPVTSHPAANRVATSNVSYTGVGYNHVPAPPAGMGFPGSVPGANPGVGHPHGTATTSAAPLHYPNFPQGFNPVTNRFAHPAWEQQYLSQADQVWNATVAQYLPSYPVPGPVRDAKRTEGVPPPQPNARNQKPACMKPTGDEQRNLRANKNTGRIGKTPAARAPAANRNARRSISGSQSNSPGHRDANGRPVTARHPPDAPLGPMPRADQFGSPSQRGVDGIARAARSPASRPLGPIPSMHLPNATGSPFGIGNAHAARAAAGFGPTPQGQSAAMQFNFSATPSGSIPPGFRGQPSVMPFNFAQIPFVSTPSGFNPFIHPAPAQFSKPRWIREGQGNVHHARHPTEVGINPQFAGIQRIPPTYPLIIDGSCNTLNRRPAGGSGDAGRGAGHGAGVMAPPPALAQPYNTIRRSGPPNIGNPAATGTGAGAGSPAFSPAQLSNAVATYQGRANANTSGPHAGIGSPTSGLTHPSNAAITAQGSGNPTAAGIRAGVGSPAFGPVQPANAAATPHGAGNVSTGGPRASIGSHTSGPSQPFNNAVTPQTPANANTSGPQAGIGSPQPNAAATSQSPGNVNNARTGAGAGKSAPRRRRYDFSAARQACLSGQTRRMGKVGKAKRGNWSMSIDLPLPPGTVNSSDAAGASQNNETIRRTSNGSELGAPGPSVGFQVSNAEGNSHGFTGAGPPRAHTVSGPSAPLGAPMGSPAPVQQSQSTGAPFGSPPAGYGSPDFGPTDNFENINQFTGDIGSLGSNPAADPTNHLARPGGNGN